MSFRKGLVAALLLGSSALPSWAAEYYVAPQGHTSQCAPNGSLACPWDSVKTALADGRVVGGDVIRLMSGHHGEIVIVGGAAFDENVTIVSDVPLQAQVDYILLRKSVRGLTFRNISVSGGGSPYEGLVFADASTSDLVFDGLDVRSQASIADRLSWTSSDWGARAENGMWTFGARTTIHNNTFTVVRHGIIAEGPGSTIRRNKVMDFSGDGIRAFSDSTVSENYVANSFKVDGNHDDGFQSFARNGVPVSNLIIDGNQFIEWTYADDHPLRGVMQGIGLFNGNYDDLVIQNNVVSAGLQHGITITSARRAKILNNTVVSSSGMPGKYPWIYVAGASNDVIVANNISMKFLQPSDASQNVRLENNRIILDPSAVFEDVGQNNYRPKPSSGFLDVADIRFAPVTDILGSSRPYGDGPDLGAYEVGATGGTSGSTPGPITSPTPTAPTPAPAPTDTSVGLTTTTTPAPSPTPTTSPTTSTVSTSGTTTTPTAPTTTTSTPSRTAGKWVKPRSLSDLISRLRR